MQRVLPHEQTRKCTHSRKTEDRPKDISQRIHVGVFRASHPAVIWQILDLFQIITQTTNDRGSFVFSFELLP